jgi:hypothetical protein|tara:strand:+ start:186 stop:545 length:360 start_codon:yes stop_codon:yes gene_type:complete
MTYEAGEHWLVQNLRTEVIAIDPDLIVTQEHGFQLPDRSIATAWIRKLCQSVMRVDGKVLFEGPAKEVTACKISLNTGPSVSHPIDVTDMNEDAAEVVVALMSRLHERQENLFQQTEAA